MPWEKCNYVTCALMQNARRILYGSATSEYFGLNSSTLESQLFTSFDLMFVKYTCTCNSVAIRQTCGRSQEFRVKIEHNLRTSHLETSKYQSAIK